MFQSMQQFAMLHCLSGGDDFLMICWVGLQVLSCSNMDHLPNAKLAVVCLVVMMNFKCC